MARKTLCQFERTAATATRRIVEHQQQHKVIALSRAERPSVPSDNIDNFSSSVCICAASPALKSCSCFKFSSSARFSFIRARSIGDCADGCEPAIEGCRRLELTGRLR